MKISIAKSGFGPILSHIIIVNVVAMVFLKISNKTKGTAVKMGFLQVFCQKVVTSLLHAMWQHMLLITIVACPHFWSTVKHCQLRLMNALQNGASVKDEYVKSCNFMRNIYNLQFPN